MHSKCHCVFTNLNECCYSANDIWPTFFSLSSSHSCFTFVMNILLFLRNTISVEIHGNMESVLTTWSNHSFDHFKITISKVFGDQDQNLEFSMDSVQSYFAMWIVRFWKHLTKNK